MRTRKAISMIERAGILLVYPIDNRREPPSLWYGLHPRTPMRWEWDDSGDDRVARLWRLREELSRSGRVVYAKWYRGRATFLSREAFVAARAALDAPGSGRERLSREARTILETLELDSPLSTKELKRATGLQGRLHAPAYERALRELWERLLIVGYGERDDGAFPSLLVGSARVLFEDLWEEARGMSPDRGRELLHSMLPEGSLFLKWLDRVSARPANPARPAGAPGPSRPAALD